MTTAAMMRARQQPMLQLQQPLATVGGVVLVVLVEAQLGSVQKESITTYRN